MNFRHLAPPVIACFLLIACSRTEVKPAPPPPVKAAPVVKQEKPKPRPVKAVKKPRPKPPVVVLLSESIPAYQQVANELEKRLTERSTVINLDTSSMGRKRLIKQLNRKDYQQFVAIGLEAAKLAKMLAGKEDELIFCQVFNYQKYNMVGPRAKGVSALPGTAEMFARWSEMSPSLKRVGVITGPGLETVFASASKEAAKHGIELQHRVVATDKELLFEYKQLAPALQGLWMLPDNRVLSGRTIKEVMSFSVRNGKQVAVFSDAILRLGGVLSITTRPEEIAAKVEQRLQAAYKGKGVPGPELLLLEQGDIKVNSVAAKRYNLKYMEKQGIRE